MDYYTFNKVDAALEKTGSWKERKAILEDLLKQQRELSAKGLPMSKVLLPRLVAVKHILKNKL